MPIYQHKIERDEEGAEIHYLATQEGGIVFRGYEHQVITFTFGKPGNRYIARGTDSALPVAEFLAYLRDRKTMKPGSGRSSSRTSLAIPANPRRGADGKLRKGRSVD